MKEIYLYQLSKQLKLFLTSFLIVLSIGVLVGLFFLYTTTVFDKEVTINRLNVESKTIEEDFGINEAPIKSDGELLTTTHNHVIGFSFIFFFVGGIFYFNSIVKGFWKMFLLIEPFFSIIVSFGSMWLVRYYVKDLILLTIISAVLIYLSYFIMVIISLYDLNFKK